MTHPEPYCRFPELTHQQRLVTNLLVNGMSNKEIGRELGISPRTVEDHRSGIYKRLGVSNIAGLVKKFYTQGGG